MSRDLAYGDFWNLTPREIAQIIEGRDKFRLAEHEARRAIAHEQAMLIHYAILAPKKMPKYKPMKAEQELSAEAQTELVRAFFMSKVRECSIQ